MFPSQHLFLGIIFGVGLFIIIPSIGIIGLGVVILSSVLIDFDHYIFYTLRCRNLNPIKSYNWFIEKTKKFMGLSREERNRSKLEVYAFHGVELLLVLIFLSFFKNFFILIFAGFSFHLLLDMIYQPIVWDNFNKFSLINDFLKRK